MTMGQIVVATTQTAAVITIGLRLRPQLIYQEPEALKALRPHQIGK